MITATELVDWLHTFCPDGNVAVDEGGLTLVALDGEGKPTGEYLEVGGIP